MTKEKIPDLKALVEKAKKGDTVAFGQIYDALVKPVYRYIYYRVDPQIAEDLTEETFLKTWQNLKKYKKGKTPFSSWVFKIAHNLVCDYYRKHQPVSEINENLIDPQEHLSPKRRINVKFNQIKLRQTIKKLPDSYQQVIILKYINELDNADIAKTIGKSEGAVRVLQFRALQQLRSLLGEKQEDF
ncbi:RNA polymerase sigma factor [Patescibacteria group bacterium]|nr:RNA polymerase sigma factor [Patescibacteria group bacterium]MBU1682404.1 RNA polymerase sigma factor [Patescibacteria group bacterium]MBU1934625.1 RNA polymerase sigma factor [Patescibacteria group bacterium]